MISHVFHLHAHAKTRCFRQSSNVSMISSHCVVPQATSTGTVEHHFFPRRSNNILHKRESVPANQHHTTHSEMANVNGIIWKGVQLALKSHNLQISNWEMVLPSVLHSIRSLMLTATNTTPMRGSSCFNVVLCVVCHYHHG